MKQIQIYGAGLSGLVAAINLAKEGYNVVIFEREKDIGGSPQFHPSAHLTPLHGPSTWEYIGIDLQSYFHSLEKFTVYIGSRRFDLDPSPLYVVERGGRKTSLDYYLFEEAKKLGVDFQFSSPFTTEKLSSLPPNTIIATGLFPEAYKILKIPYVTFEYYIAVGNTELKDLSLGYWDHYTPDYGYVAITNGLILALVFSRVKINPAAEHLFAEALRKTEGINIQKWRFFSGANPVQPNLFAGNYILAGNVAGMMEPIYTFGIVGAVHSGKLAALAITNREKAIKDFKYFTRTHRIAYKITDIVRITPWSFRKPFLSSVLANPDRYGFAIDYICNGIPGYKGERFVKAKKFTPSNINYAKVE